MNWLLYIGLFIPYFLLTCIFYGAFFGLKDLDTRNPTWNFHLIALLVTTIPTWIWICINYIK